MGEILRLYHYIKAEYLTEFLSEGKLKLTDISRTNDPAEYLPTHLSESPADYYMAKYVIESVRRDTPFLILSCSRLMSSLSIWGNYGDSHQGVCLVFDIPYDHVFKNGRVIYTTFDSDIRLLKVVYNIHRVFLRSQDLGWSKDKSGKPSWDKLYTPLAYKGRDWWYENEYRLDFTNQLSSPEIEVNDGLYFCRNIRKYCVGILLGINCKLQKKYVEKIISQEKQKQMGSQPTFPSIVVERVKIHKKLFKIVSDNFCDSMPMKSDVALSEKDVKVRENMSLAEIYHYGNERIDPDVNMAIKYYERAANEGYIEAIDVLCELLEETGRVEEVAQWKRRLESTSSDS